MAWTTPPTFADGDYLTAANLNILSDDVEYLYARARQVNAGFVVRTVNDSDNSNDTVSGWSVLHLSNTFRYRLSFTGNADYIYIRYNAVNIWQVNTPTAGIITGTVDLTSQGLTLGTIYGLSVTTRAPSGETSSVEVQYLGEEW